MRLSRKKRVTRKEIKKDLLVMWVEKLFFYFRHRIEIFKIGGAIVGGVILIFIVSLLIFGHIKRSKESKILSCILDYYEKDADYAKVATKFEEFYKKNRGHKKAPLALFYQASCYFFIKDYKKARELWEEFIRRYSRHLLANNAYHNIAKTYEEENSWEEAINTYKKALELYPRDSLAPYYHLAKANCYFRLKKYKLACKECKEIIHNYPDSEWVEDARYYLKEYKRQEKEKY